MGAPSGGGIVSIVFPPHYTAHDIQAVKDISVWCAATARSTAALARMIGGSNGTMSSVLRGKYASSPSPILARVLKAAGQRLPKGWEALLPVDEPALPVVCDSVQTVIPPTPMRPVMTAWEPGAVSTREKGLREQIHRLVSKHSSQNPMDLGELLNRLGNTPDLRSALDGMIADRELLMAKVSRFGNTYIVIYPVGRVPVERPGRRATTKPRGPNIVITPSTRAGSGRGSRP